MLNSILVINLTAKYDDKVNCVNNTQKYVLNGMKTCKLSRTSFFVRLHIMVDRFVCLHLFPSSAL